MSCSRHIFVVDDDESIRRSLGRVMTQAGLSWEAFESADQFLARRTPDMSGCILADLSLVGMGGLELKETLTADHDRLPFIFLTSADTPEARAAAHEAGAAGFFRKPVDSQALIDAIEWILQEPRGRMQEPLPDAGIIPSDHPRPGADPTGETR